VNRKYKHIHLDLKEIPIKIEEATHGEKTMNSDKKRIRNLRILVGVLIAFIALDFMASYQIYEDKVALQDELNCTKQQVTIYKAMAIDAQSKMEDYKQANEALLKYAEPKSVVKAIKHTPLPRLKGC